MNLPQHKIDQLSDKVADDIVRVVNDNAKTMREREVSPEDRGQIIREGYKKAGKRPLDNE